MFQNAILSRPMVRIDLMIRTLAVQTSSKFIELAMIWRGLAIIGVVVEHAIGWGFTAMFWWTDRYRPVTVPNFDQIGSTNYYISHIFEAFFAFCLPMFFLISGFFMQLTFQSGGPAWGKIFKRIKRLVVPFLIWSVVMMLLNIIQGHRYSVLTFIFVIITGNSAAAFYFVPVLIQLYLLAPFIIDFLRKRPRLVLVSTALIQLFSVSLAYGVILNVNTPVIKQLLLLNNGASVTNHIFWFTLGIAIGNYFEKIDGRLERAKWLLLGLSVVSYILMFVEWDNIWRMSGEVWIARRFIPSAHIYSFFFILTLLAFRDWKPPLPKLTAYLGSKSYGIYLVHALVMTIAAKIIYHIAPALLSANLLYQLVLVSVGIAVPLLMMGFIARVASGRYYVYLFGRK